MEPDEVIRPGELAGRIIQQTLGVAQSVASACATYVPADERETVCGSFLFALNQAIEKLERWAPDVAHNPDTARRFAKLTRVVLDASADMVANLRADWGFTGRFATLAEAAAPGLRADLDAMARAFQSMREELRDAAETVAESKAWTRTVLISTVVLAGVVVFVVIFGPSLFARTAAATAQQLRAPPENAA